MYCKAPKQTSHNKIYCKNELFPVKMEKSNNTDDKI